MGLPNLDDGLLAQHKLLLAVLGTDWATRLDHKVAAQVIERYYPKYGGARVSLRFLQAATGSTRPNIIASTRRLVANGVFWVKREGKGTAPTEYGLNFSFPMSGIADDTTTEPAACGTADDTAGGTAHGTARTASGTAHGTETDLPSPAYVPADGKVEIVSPSAGGPMAAAAGEGFDRIWVAYDKLGNKVAARAAFEAIENPDVDHIVERARAWAASAKPGQKRMPLEKWLAAEKYDEADRKVQPKPEKTPANDERPAARQRGRVTDQLRVIEVETFGHPSYGDYRYRLKLDGPDGHQEHMLEAIADGRPGEHRALVDKLHRAFAVPDDWPGQRLRLEIDDDRIVDIIPERKPDCVVTIATSALVEEYGSKLIVAKVVDADSKPEGEIVIIYESDDTDEQAAGQEKLARLLQAVGMSKIDDTDELVGRVFLLTGKGDYVPVAEAA